MCVGAKSFVVVIRSYLLAVPEVFFFFQAEDGIRDLVRSLGLGDVYKRQVRRTRRRRAAAALRAVVGWRRDRVPAACDPHHAAVRLAAREPELALSLIHL